MNRNEFTNFLTPKKILQLQLAEETQPSPATANDSFMTADESNNTQFFSVLEDSNAETTLDDITYDPLEDADFTFTNNVNEGVIKGDRDEDEEPEIDINNELVIFKSPHSSKMFGLQTATDEEGNLQKYQYEVLQNEQGQFEGIPHTLQMVPLETDPAAVIQQMEAQDESDCHLADIGVNSLETEDYIKDYNVGIKLENNYQDNLYITLEQKPDLQDHITQDQINEQFHDLCLSLENTEADKAEDSLQDRYTPNLVESEEISEEHEAFPNSGLLEQKSAKPCILESALKGIYSPVKSEQDFYSEATQDEPETVPEQVKQIIPLPKINTGAMRTIALYPISRDVIKQRNKVITTIELPQRAKPLKTLNTQKRLVSASSTVTSNSVVISPQKENLEIKSTLEHIGHGILKRNNRRTPTKVEAYDLASTSALESKDKKKNQTWNVNKMISQTKIIEAPVRQERLPRKQKIKPLSRVGEELVFQHVTVMANGMIETKVDGVVQEVKPLQASECIQISDTEDDFSWKMKRKLKKSKKIEIVISDSEEEIDTTKESELSEESVKSHSLESDQGSLKTNLETQSLEEKTVDTSSNTKTGTKKTAKYSCTICPETFINAFLCNKHVQQHKLRTKIECAVCKRLFNNLPDLNRHKKEHNTNTKATTIKRPLRSVQPVQDAEIKTDLPTCTTKLKVPVAVGSKPVKTTSKPANSPAPAPTVAVRRRSLRPPTMQPRKSMLPPPGTTHRKSTLPLKVKQTTRSMLPPTSTSTIPKRVSTASKFKCFTCGSIYPSKVTLDSHIINNCVKSPRRTPPAVGLNRTVATTSKLMPPGDAKGKFKSASMQNLNSTVANRSSVSSSFKRVPVSARHRIPTNAGIPANSGMRQAFNNLKRKLMEDDMDSDEFDKDKDKDISGKSRL